MGKKDEGKQGQFWTGAEDTPLFCGTPGRVDDPGRFEPEPAARQARLFGRDTVEGLAEGQRRARARKRRLQGQEAPEDGRDGDGPLFDGQDEDEATAEDAEETPDASQDADPVYVCPQCRQPMDGACQCPPCMECERFPLDCNCEEYAADPIFDFPDVTMVQAMDGQQSRVIGRVTFGDEETRLRLRHNRITGLVTAEVYAPGKKPHRFPPFPEEHGLRNAISWLQEYRLQDRAVIRCTIGENNE